MPNFLIHSWIYFSLQDLLSYQCPTVYNTQHLHLEDPPSVLSFLDKSHIYLLAPYQILGQKTNDDSRKEREGHSRNYFLLLLVLQLVSIYCSVHSLITEKFPQFFCEKSMICYLIFLRNVNEFYFKSLMYPGSPLISVVGLVIPYRSE